MTRKIQIGLLFFTIALAFFAVARLSPFNYIDDAFISFRYAENLAQGHGLVFNIGERVEGYSTTLFVLLLAAIGRLTGYIPIGGMILGVLFHAATVAMTAVFLRRFVGEPFWRPAPIFALAFLTFHPIGVAYAESGMETSLAAFLTALTAYFATAASQAERPARPAAAAGAAMLALALTRPEMIVLAAPLAIWLWRGERGGRLRRTLPFVGILAVGTVAFEIWRHAYFHEWLPNTYYAKAAGAGLSLIFKGLKYFGRYLMTTWFPLALVPLAILLWRNSAAARVPRWWWGLGAAALTHIAAVIWVGGDHFPLSRFFAPITPLLLILLVQGCQSADEILAARRASWAPAKQQAARWAIGALLLPATIFTAMVFPNEGIIFIRLGVLASNWCGIGKELARDFPPGTSVGLVPIGAIGFCSKLPIVDLVGLTDKTIARTPADLAGALPGHGRRNSRYVLTHKKPQIILTSVRCVPWPVPPWVVRRSLYQPADLDLVQQLQFMKDYGFHRLHMKAGYLHYYSRRDFETAETNPAPYPVPGVESPFPPEEPAKYGSLLDFIRNERRGGLGLKWWGIW